MEDFARAVADFVRHHQAWAAPIVLVLAFGESLAFISLLIPGLGALVAIGALIGVSGISFWPVWIAGGLGCCAGRLALLLVRLQLQGAGRADLAAVALPGDPAARRGLRVEVGRALAFSSDVLQATARLGTARCRHLSRCPIGRSRSPISSRRWSGRRCCCCSAT